MKIAFVWYFDRASEILPNWRDGLRAAIEIIEKDNEVVWFLDEKTPDPNENWDAILFWGDSNCPFFSKISDYKCKKGLFLSTMPQNIDNLRKLDVIYCESQVVLAAVKAHGLPGVLGFGTDTDFFSPDLTITKDIEFFYPATFSPWKSQDFLASLGARLLCVGTVQPDGKEILKTCQEAGVRVITDYVPVEEIRDYYRRTQNVVIPAVHGSERTVLETMSMNILPRVFTHNGKAATYIREYLNSAYIFPRDFVIDNYSARVYAKEILEGLNAS